MKILMTSVVDLKKSQHNRPHQFARYLSEDHEVTVLSINDWWKGGQDDLERYSSDFDDLFERIEILYLTEKKVSPVLQELFSAKKVKEVLKRDFDVHLNYNTLISGYFASKRIKTVYDLADDLTAMVRASPQIPVLLRPFGGIIGDFMMDTNIKRSERVTVTTDALMRSYNIPNARCEVIPNGVDTTLFRDRSDTKEELGLGGFVIGYVGVLREWVDLKPVFLALKDLDPEITMLVVGKEGEFEENVNLAKRCGVQARVVFTGMVSYTEVPKYISAMDICLIPFARGAISENALPLKLFEYMACEKPVIATELAGVKRVAGDDVMYVNDAKGYEKRISELYGNDELRRDMGRAGRRLVESGHDWKGIVKRMEGVLIETAAM